MPKNIALDATVLNSMACARYTNFRFNHNLILKGGKSNSMECGSLAHFILEHFNKALMQGKFRTDAVAIGMAAGMEYVNGFNLSNKYLLDADATGMENTPEESEKIGNREII